MYSGKVERVELRFINPLLDAVYDKFGDVHCQPVDETHFSVQVEVAITDQFFGWLCGFGNKAKLLSPSPVIEEFTKHLAKMQELYQ